MTRRKILKTGVTALIWKTPVISSVVLPVHAQTSSESFRSDLFRITGLSGQKGFNFNISNNRVQSVTESQLTTADLFIELGHSAIKGTVNGALIFQNYSGNLIPKNHVFLPDSQSGNVPFTIPLDDLPPSTAVNLELNYFESSTTLELRILISDR